MIIYVAIDVLNGQVVRLERGDVDKRTVYSDDPVSTAIRWQQEGARWLHVVDLNAATTGEGTNRGAIERLLDSTDIPVQVAGGIRHVGTAVDWLERGAERVCVGTKSLDEKFLADAVAAIADRLVVAVDSRNGEVQVEGWLRGSGRSVVEVAKYAEAAGVTRLLCTDIGRDGMLGGPNLDLVEEVLDSTGIAVIASGGVSSQQDLDILSMLIPKGLDGVVVGKALYSGAVCLPSV